MKRIGWGVHVGLASLFLTSFSFGVAYVQKLTPMRVLMIGGGPEKKHNQVAIEGNIRYAYKSLPQGTPMRVLFTDGNPNSTNVQYEGENKRLLYRAPMLQQQDGPASAAQLQTEFANLVSGLKSRPNTRTFLYFTGHGSPSRQNNYENNHFDLWNGDTFSVKDMAAVLKTFDKSTPITLVMVQCFSGAFANILFEDGDATKGLIDQKVCGFFASVAQRPAAGCTPEINEAEYRDFTSYFFAALTGIDRVGRKVLGIDYNRDGKVGMNEAYAYALLSDDSIDTPVCTSDAFLRKFVTTPDEEIFKTPFSKVQSWATKSQRVALDGLAELLHYSGDNCLQTAFDRMLKIKVDSDDMADVRTMRFIRLSKSIVLAQTLNAKGDKKIKGRYNDLIKMEAGNPFRD